MWLIKQSSSLLTALQMAKLIILGSEISVGHWLKWMKWVLENLGKSLFFLKAIFISAKH